MRGMVRHPFLSPLVAVLLAVALAGAACGRAVDLAQALEVTDVRTGWYDAGIVEGQKNKLVPSISIRLKNRSAGTVASVQLNAIFRQVSDSAAWGEHFAKAIGPDGIPSGGSTDPIVLRSNLGYTSADQSRLQMLRNSQFVDAKVEIYGKTGSRTWVKLGEFAIARDLLTEQ